MSGAQDLSIHKSIKTVQEGAGFEVFMFQPPYSFPGLSLLQYWFLPEAPNLDCSREEFMEANKGMPAVIPGT